MAILLNLVKLSPAERAIVVGRQRIAITCTATSVCARMEADGQMFR